MADGLSQADADALADDYAARQLTPSRRAAIARAGERANLAALGGGLAAAELTSGRSIRCEHERLRVLCPTCSP